MCEEQVVRSSEMLFFDLVKMPSIVSLLLVYVGFNSEVSKLSFKFQFFEYKIVEANGFSGGIYRK